MKVAFFLHLILHLVLSCHGTAPVTTEAYDVDPYTRIPTTNPTEGIPVEATEQEFNVCAAEEIYEELKTCYEEKPNYVPLVSRREWNLQSPRQLLESRDAPAELVVISEGGKHCTTKISCLSNLRTQNTADNSSPCEFKENFYVGEDGHVYEGRGWDYVPYWYMEGMRNYSITVKFMGHFSRQLPKDRALRAFHSAMTLGIWTGKLSAHYKILTIDQVTSGQKCVGEALKNEVKSWAGWVDDSETTSMWEHHDSEVLALASRRSWNSSRSCKIFLEYHKPARYILLNNVHDRCNTREQCSHQLRTLQRTQLDDFGDLLDNFYIGDDGTVYEGRGWGVVPHWQVEGIRKTYISVSIFGSYQTELPTQRALSAFKALVQTGVKLGELSPDFKILSLRLIYDDRSFLGDALKLQAENWTPWARDYDEMIPQERVEAKLVPIMYRSSLKGLPNPKPVIQEVSSPIQFIILKDGGDNCYNVAECTDILNTEMRTHMGTYGNLLDSFYVGSDGIVYEGLGWDSLPSLYIKYLRNSYITIKFLGNFQNDIPNNLALRAFQSFIRLGIDLRKISPSYQIYSLRHIYNESSFLGNALSEYSEGLPQWSSEMAVEDDEERKSKGLLPMVPRDDWDDPLVGKTIDLVNGTAQYVFVGDTGDSCLTHEKCLVRMREEQTRGLDLYGSLTDNFYVGEDGNVYEGLGWSGYSVNDKDTGKNAIFVRFFGNFHRAAPSKLAEAAFHRLIKYGLNTENLSGDYVIISMRRLCNCNDGVGDALQRQMEKWERYQPEHDPLTFSGSVPYVRHLIVQREEWNAEPKTKFKSTGQRKEPADYVVLSAEGERCFDREECGNIIKGALKTSRDKNFFFAEDGRLYEGSGWGSDPSWKFSCPNCSILTVSYLGNFSSEAPSATAVEAFEFLMSWGVRVGTISPEYKLVSIDQLCNNHTNLDDDALGIEIKKWKHWSPEISLPLDCNMLYGRIISRASWGATKAIHGGLRKGTVDYIFVRDGRQRCFTHQECSSLMVKEHTLVQRYTGVLENFYIGDDGNVYEGRGWSRRPQYEFHPKYYSDDDSDEYDDERPAEQVTSINVLFFGPLEIENPTDVQIEAFKNLIVRTGINLGFLKPNFKLRAVPDGTYSINVGRKLKDSMNLLLSH
ncbi:uncharacterized protein LOC124162272 [Ischnura elegans]|uniref:uncharacterized protein LOC124162272 n=1 Tax=Ischnura elegans TaxID=197161 RepID=UPI001ED86F4E|nr:uncharacterized protein LOC124162272 [Ischnura elegans]